MYERFATRKQIKQETSRVRLIKDDKLRITQ